MRGADSTAGAAAEYTVNPLSAKADGVWGRRDLRSEKHHESQDANHGNVREDANALAIGEI